jgi:hypothetical protein
MSTSITSDDTGLKLQTLKGQENFTAWLRDFRVIAATKGVMDLFTGDEDIIEKPHKVQFLPLHVLAQNITRLAQSQAQAIEDAKSDAQKKEELELKAADHSFRLQQFNSALHDFEEQLKRVRIANGLLAYYVDPSLRGGILECKTPKEAFDHIKELCKQSDARALDDTLGKIERLSLSQCSSVSDYLNQLETLRLDIKDLGGDYTYEHITSKVIRGLTSSYDSFVDHYHLIQEDPAFTRPTDDTGKKAALKRLHAQLLSQEAKIKERNKKSPNNNAGRKRKEGKEDHSDNHDERRPKKKCSHCGRIGHEEPTCFHKHPELKKAQKFTQQKEHKDKEVTMVESTEKKDEKASKHIVCVITSSRDAFTNAYNSKLTYAEVVSGIKRDTSETPSTPITPTPTQQQEPSKLTKDLCHEIDQALNTPAGRNYGVKQHDDEGWQLVSHKKPKSKKVDFVKKKIFIPDCALPSSPAPSESASELFVPSPQNVPSQRHQRFISRLQSSTLCVTCNDECTEKEDAKNDQADGTDKGSQSEDSDSTGFRKTPVLPIDLDYSVQDIEKISQSQGHETQNVQSAFLQGEISQVPHQSYHPNTNGLTESPERVELVRRLFGSMPENYPEASGMKPATQSNTSSCKPIDDTSTTSDKGHDDDNDGPSQSSAVHVSPEILMLDDSNIANSTWLVDSGANEIIVNNKAWFTSFRPMNHHFGTANDASGLKIEGGGTVQLKLQVPGKSPTTLTLSKVAYAPTLRCNVLSLSCLAERAKLRGGWSIEGITITEEDGQILGEAKLSDGLFYLQLAEVPEDLLASENPALSLPGAVKPPGVVALVDLNDDVWKWHRKMGHLSLNNLAKLLKISDGIGLTEKQILAKVKEICPICAISKAIKRIPKDPATRRMKEVGFLMHADVYIYNKVAWDGTAYILAITDDATRFTWSARLQKRGDLPAAFIQLHRLIQKQRDIKVRSYRFDHEFLRNDELSLWMEKNAITIEVNVPHEHYMNGVSERAWRTERDKAAAMVQEQHISEKIMNILDARTAETLRQTTLPETLWPEAFEQAIWLKNRSPTRALKSKITPWEALNGLKPNLAVERIFGSRTFAAIPPEKRGVKSLYSPRANLGYFVGRESESVLRVWDPEAKKVLRITDARTDDGQGLDDPHPGESLFDPREPTDDQLQGEPDSTTNSDSEGDDISPPQQSDVIHDLDFAGDREINMVDSPSPSKPNYRDFKCNHCWSKKFRKCSQQDARRANPDVTDLPPCDRCVEIDEPCRFDPDMRKNGTFGPKTGKKVRLQCNECFRGDHKDCSQQSIRQADPTITDLPPCNRCVKSNQPCSFDAAMKKDGTFGPKLYSHTRTNCDPCFQGNHKNCSQIPLRTNDPMAKEIPPCSRCEKSGRPCTFDPLITRDGTPRTRTKHPLDLIVLRDLLFTLPVMHFRRRRRHEIMDAFCKDRGYPLVSDRSVKVSVVGDKKLVNRRSTATESRESLEIRYPGFNNEELRAELTRWIFDEYEKLMSARCTVCKNNNLHCSTIKPCRGCEGKRNCVHRPNPDSTIVVTHYPDGYAGNYSKTPKDGSECLYCFEEGVTCDYKVKFPCTGCVKRPHRKIRGCRCVVVQPDGGYRSITAQANNGTRRLRQPKERFQPTDFYGSDISAEDIISIQEEQEIWDIFSNDGNDIPQEIGSEPTLTECHSDQQAHQHGSPINPQFFDESLIDPQLLTESPKDNRKPIDWSRFESDPESDDETDDRLSSVNMITSNQADRGKWSDCFLTSTSSNLSTTSDLPPEPTTVRGALRSAEAQEWRLSMDDEYQSLIENDTWKVVPRPKDRAVLPTRWVYKRKLGPLGEVAKHKSRWVAKGFTQVHGLDFDETYASVVKAPSYRLFFALQARFGWKCHQMDIKTAFLNGLLEHTIYVEPPEGFPFEKDTVLLLNRSLYGLKQAPRQWYQRLSTFLLSQGWTVSKFDQSVFLKDGMFMTVYVDDILIFGANEADIVKVKQSLASEFKMTDLGLCAHYLGMQIHQEENGDVLIHQATYLQQALEKYSLQDAREWSVPMDSRNKLTNTDIPSTPDFRKLYQSKVGTQNWSAIVSRPDLSYAVGITAQQNANPSKEHLAAVDRTFGYIKKTRDLILHYQHDAKEPDLHAYSDADWAGCLDTRQSRTGYVIMLAGGAIAWRSRRQRSIAQSTCEAEYIAGYEAAQDLVWYKNFINELSIPGLHIKCPSLFIDNNAALKLTRNPEFHDRTKHIELKFHYIRRMVLEGEIDTKRVDSKNNLADIFTKALGREDFERLREMLGLRGVTTIEAKTD